MKVAQAELQTAKTRAKDADDAAAKATADARSVVEAVRGEGAATKAAAAQAAENAEREAVAAREAAAAAVKEARTVSDAARAEAEAAK